MQININGRVDKVNKLRILVKKVDKPFEVQEVEHTLEALQEIVGGFIEPVPCLPYPYVLVCNEEGKLDELKPNFRIDGDVIHGDVFIAKVDGIDFVSLDESDIKYLQLITKGWS